MHAHCVPGFFWLPGGCLGTRLSAPSDWLIFLYCSLQTNRISFPLFPNLVPWRPPPPQGVPPHRQLTLLTSAGDWTNWKARVSQPSFLAALIVTGSCTFCSDRKMVASWFLHITHYLHDLSVILSGTSGLGQELCSGLRQEVHCGLGEVHILLCILYPHSCSLILYVAALLKIRKQMLLFLAKFWVVRLHACTI